MSFAVSMCSTGNALLKTNSLVEFYEANYRKHSSRLSDFMSSAGGGGGSSMRRSQIATQHEEPSTTRSSWFGSLFSRAPSYASLSTREQETTTTPKKSSSSVNVD